MRYFDCVCTLKSHFNSKAESVNNYNQLLSPLSGVEYFSVNTR